MTLQTRTQDREALLQAADECWQAFFFASGAGEDPPIGGVKSLDAWSTDQLIAEVLERRAEDAPSLRLMHRRILRALVIALDNRTASGRE